MQCVMINKCLIKIFKNVYYDDILNDILKANPLWQGRNLEKTDCGFEQNLKAKNYEIFIMFVIIK